MRKKELTPLKSDRAEGVVDLVLAIFAIGFEVLAAAFMDRQRPTNPKKRR